MSTFAGSGTAGSANGTGTSATFNKPTGAACDGSGNVYVADQHNNMIRKITTAAVVSTFAGSTTAGSADGTGTSAGFNFPTSVSLDASGNVYVADQNNNTIRAITSGAVVSTLAGYHLSSGYADGPGSNARFYGPVGVAADKFGNLLVCDSHYDNIRQVAYSAFAIDPYLPAGLSFNLSTGAISGTPTEAMAATQFTVTGYSGSYSANTDITLEVLSSTAVTGPTLTNNFVISNAPRISGITSDSLLTANANHKNNLQTSIQYVDGLGRPIQTVQEQGSQDGYDLVVPQVYDRYGREVTKYLVYAPETGQYGNYRPTGPAAGT